MCGASLARACRPTKQKRRVRVSHPRPAFHHLVTYIMFLLGLLHAPRRGPVPGELGRIFMLPPFALATLFVACWQCGGCRDDRALARFI